jgi:hypothetical protein
MMMMMAHSPAKDSDKYIGVRGYVYKLLDRAFDFCEMSNGNSKPRFCAAPLS